MGGWITLSHQDLPITLKIPHPTPQGYPVAVRERSSNTSYRIHLVSEGSSEVYFEVGQYNDLELPQAVEAFVQDVSERIDGLQKSEPQETRLAGFHAYQFSIRWPGNERVILFIEKEEALFRIIYDPASSINHRILETFRFY